MNISDNHQFTSRNRFSLSGDMENLLQGWELWRNFASTKNKRHINNTNNNS